MRTSIKRFLVMTLVVAGAVFLFRDSLFGPSVETYVAVRRDLVQTVVASGRVMTPRRVSVGAVITGRVVSIPVDEGQTVKRGDVLINLLDEDERSTVLQWRASVAQAQARLRQLREVGLPAAEYGLAQAEANEVQARQQHDRNVALREKGYVSQAAVDDAARNLKIAEAQLRAARVQVQTNQPSGSDVALAQTALAQAQANLRVAEARLEHTVIRAPVDGVLIGRSVEPGNTVQPGRELMVLAPAGETQVVVQVDERNLSLLAVGQNAVCSADAYPSETFAAELFYINPGIDALRGAVEVKLRVREPPGYLRQDMTVSADIEIARSKDAVVIPADAVHDATAAEPWVLVVKDGHARRQAVKVGLRGDARVEVRAGLAAGDLVVPTTLAAVVAGQRVRASVARGVS